MTLDPLLSVNVLFHSRVGGPMLVVLVAGMHTAFLYCSIRDVRAALPLQPAMHHTIAIHTETLNSCGRVFAERRFWSIVFILSETFLGSFVLVICCQSGIPRHRCPRSLFWNLGDCISKQSLHVQIYNCFSAYIRTPRRVQPRNPKGIRLPRALLISGCPH